MSDKSIKTTEAEILKRLDEMCQESLSPDVYFIWKDIVVPKLVAARKQLSIPCGQSNHEFVLEARDYIKQSNESGSNDDDAAELRDWLENACKIIEKG
jgi:hypothetical protein